jgi:hypothetical protein
MVLPGAASMEAVSQPITSWWNSFKGLVGTFFVEMGPAEYSYILVISFVAGYLWLRSGSPR